MEMKGLKIRKSKREAEEELQKVMSKAINFYDRRISIGKNENLEADLFQAALFGAVMGKDEKARKRVENLYKKGWSKLTRKEKEFIVTQVINFQVGMGLRLLDGIVGKKTRMAMDGYSLELARKGQTVALVGLNLVPRVSKVAEKKAKELDRKLQSEILIQYFQYNVNPKTDMIWDTGNYVFIIKKTVPENKIWGALESEEKWKDFVKRYGDKVRAYVKGNPPKKISIRNLPYQKLRFGKGKTFMFRF